MGQPAVDAAPKFHCGFLRGNRSDALAQPEERQDGDDDDDCADDVNDAIHEISPFARVEEVKRSNRLRLKESVANEFLLHPLDPALSVRQRA